MMNSIMARRPKARAVLAGLAAVLFWIAVWQIISMLVAQELLVPAPLVVARTWVRLMGTVKFWQATALSLLRILAGFAAAVAAGSILAVLTARFKAVRVLFSPLLHVVRDAPVVSFIILAMVWIHTNSIPSFISFLMVMPMVWSNVEKGIQETDRELLEMAQVYRFGWWKTMRVVRIPSLMPYLMAACTTGLGFAWKSGIAAEVLCRPAVSIGKYLQDAKMYLETPEVFAWTATVILLSVLLEKLLLAAVHHFGKRYNTQS